ncbi:MAG: hypothetical protein WAN18_08030, partial [Candidatus Sulfotelmatobacter sp.]
LLLQLLTWQPPSRLLHQCSGFAERMSVKNPSSGRDLALHQLCYVLENRLPTLRTPRIVRESTMQITCAGIICELT